VQAREHELLALRCGITQCSGFDERARLTASPGQIYVTQRMPIFRSSTVKASRARAAAWASRLSLHRCRKIWTGRVRQIFVAIPPRADEGDLRDTCERLARTAAAGVYAPVGTFTFSHSKDTRESVCWYPRRRVASTEDLGIAWIGFYDIGGLKATQHRGHEWFLSCVAAKAREMQLTRLTRGCESLRE
jgi:hypothetical protein